jgi:hypothetical protein
MKERQEEWRREKREQKLRGQYSPRKWGSRRFLVPGLAVVAIGLSGWLFYPALIRGFVHPRREPVERGKRLGVWLDQYRKSVRESHPMWRVKMLKRQSERWGPTPFCLAENGPSKGLGCWREGGACVGAVFRRGLSFAGN